MLWLLALAGCPGSLDRERFGDGGSCPPVESAILLPTCGGAGCHAAQQPASALDLETKNVLARLANQPAVGGGILVTPGSPDSSVLFTKLRAQPPFGARMPLGGTLDNFEIQCVRAWIEGAP